ncbi:F204A protein, partial [Eolophus roseicapillus]|nr:F204A protein [Eolophus roseicapilla]
MWSGLLPPGLNESDVVLSSDGGDESHGSFSKEDVKDVEGVQVPELKEDGPKSNATSEPVVISAVPEENESQPCPSGISLHMWNKFLELQKKSHEMKTQSKQESKGRKRKRCRKGILYHYRIYFLTVELLANEEKWKELTQYFGINDRFESPVDSRAPQKSGLELSIEKSVAEGDIDKAEELSDRLAAREVSGLLTKAL